MLDYPRTPAPWTETAICGTHDNPDLWFSEEPADVREAVRVCGNCPALVECRTASVAEPFGVWGGVPDPTQGRKAGLPSRYVRQKGLHPHGRDKRVTEAKRTQLQRLWNEGVAVSEIARMMDTRPSRVRDAVRKAREAGWDFPQRTKAA